MGILCGACITREAEEASKVLSHSARAAINTLLLVSQDAPTDMCPGTVYLVPWKATDQNPRLARQNTEGTKEGAAPSGQQLDGKNVRPPPTEQKRDPLATNRERIGGFVEFGDAARDTFFNKTPPGSVPILVEVTPVCDFAQDNQQMLRLVAGFLCPFDQAWAIRAEANYLKRFGPILLGKQNGIEPSMYVIVLNLHFVFALKKCVGKQLTASFRLKTVPLADLVSTLGNHMGRPGTLQLEVKFPPAPEEVDNRAQADQAGATRRESDVGAAG